DSLRRPQTGRSVSHWHRSVAPAPRANPRELHNIADFPEESGWRELARDSQHALLERTVTAPANENRRRSKGAAVDGEGPARARRRKRPRPSLALPVAALLLGGGAAYLVLSSCGKGGEPPQPAHATSAVAPGATAEPMTAGGGKGLIDPRDGGGNNLVAIPTDAFIDERGEKASTHVGPMLGAAHFMTHVWERPDYSSKRSGYRRAGAKVPILGAVPGEAVKRIRSPSCKEGWVAIAPRGYVCLDKGGGALNLEQPNVKLATAPPNFDDLLPYKYGF